MKTRLILLMAAVLAVLAAPAQAGLVIHEDTMGGNQMVIYIQDNKLFNDSNQMASLVDLDKGWIYMINKAEKKYWGGPMENFEKEMMAAMDKRIDEQMKDMPEDQRKAMKERIKQNMTGLAGEGIKVEVVETGKSDKVAGYDCREFQVKAGGEVRESHWIASGVKISDEVDLGKMRTQLGKLKMGAGPGGLASAKEVLDLWEKGYPLKKVYRMMGQEMISQVKKVEKKKLDPKFFEIPSSFQQVPVAEVMGMF